MGPGTRPAPITKVAIMLIGTSDVRVWLSVKPGDDTLNPKIEAAIKAAQAFCDSYTGRILEAATYTSNPECYYDGMGSPIMYLSQTPVSHINKVNVDADREFGTASIIGTDIVYFYKSGKVITEGNYFPRGRRNVRVDYNAGYAPIVGGTHNTAVGTYPIPYDLKQVMTEMAVQIVNAGMVAVQAVVTGDNISFIQLMAQNSFWKKTLDAYKDYSLGLNMRDE